MNYKILKSDVDEKNGDITKRLAEILNKAKDEDECVISFEKGEYHFYKDFAARETLYTSNTDADRFPQKSVAINIKNTKNLTIDGGGSLFLMHGDMMAIAMCGCENISLKNFSWDFPCPTTFEMQVMASGKFYTDYYIAPCFEYEIKGNKLFWFEKSPINGEAYWKHVNEEQMYCVVGHDLKTDRVKRYQVWQGPLFSVRKIEKLQNGLVRVHYWRKVHSSHREGMVFELCTSRIRECTGGFASESKNISLENVNIHYMHGFGFLIQMSENVSFDHCNFVPREGSGKHTTSYADLIHASGAKGEIKITNCKFCNAHDDPINIHGTYTRVKSKIDDKTIMLKYVHTQQNGFTQFHPGDKVVFYKRDTFEPLENEREFTVSKVISPLENGNSVKEMTVTFEEKLPDCIADKLGAVGMYAAENITYTPSVIIKGNSFKSIPTRGILCTTRKKVVIEDNVFDSMTMASIYLSNDCNVWYESGPIRDMVIRNNVFYIRRSAKVETAHKGAIFIEPIIRKLGSSPIAVHSNILIENNVFHMEHENVLYAQSTKNITFRNNEIKKIDSENADKIIKAFRFSNCSDITIENNKVQSDVDMSY